MTFDPSIANGQTVMDVLQLQATLAGYSLVDPDGVTVEPASGLAVDVTFTTDARLGGPAESVADVTGHSLPGADPDDPRKVLLYLDANGDVQSIAGDAVSALPEGEERSRAGVPALPIPSEAFLPLAEIWLAAGASSITDNDISSRRMPFAQGDGSGLNADLFKGSDSFSHTDLSGIESDQHHTRPSQTNETQETAGRQDGGAFAQNQDDETILCGLFAELLVVSGTSGSRSYTIHYADGSTIEGDISDREEEWVSVDGSKYITKFAGEDDNVTLEGVNAVIAGNHNHSIN